MARTKSSNAGAGPSNTASEPIASDAFCVDVLGLEEASRRGD